MAAVICGSFRIFLIVRSNTKWEVIIRGQLFFIQYYLPINRPARMKCPQSFASNFIRTDCEYKVGPSKEVPNVFILAKTNKN